LFNGADQQHAQTVLGEGDEAWTLQGAFTRGVWRIEEHESGALPQSWLLRVEPELAGAWGLLDLTIDSGHFAGGRDFAVPFSARSDTLRYYVVATRFADAEFNQLQLVDTGFTADGRPQLAFARLLPAAFDATHLSPALLDPSGTARIALFEAPAVTRRARGPTGLELHNNGTVLVSHLPQPGADRPDAQFVVHLTQA
jgi:hypothetical protein